ncbi:MAG TPA: TonB-dependent receptor, partial [Longimicrobiales bacterium]|nr:TonB-dependent receptor [Longimicrobiales bacterium]
MSPPSGPDPERVALRLAHVLATGGIGAVLAGLALGSTPGAVAAQQAAIQGIVAEAGTGRPLENVAVMLEVAGERLYGAFSDRNGFYQIPAIRPGRYTLRSEHIGYAPHEEILTLAPGERLTVSFRLDEIAVPVDSIIVAPERGAAVRDLGRQIVTPEDLRVVPVPAGSGDLAMYLRTLPGVTTTGDRGGQLFVRGGTSSDNLVLVDGIPIYQPFHILGFFSVFPEDLVSRADFFAGGFGARYHGRTSSVLDVRLREGDPHGFRATTSSSPFIAEALVEGPTQGATWIASVRRSLVEETSRTLLGTTEPLTFESQLVKVTSTHRKDDRCSALALRTADRGRLDPEERESHVSWENLLFGLRCVTLRPSGKLLEVHWSYSGSSSAAVSRGSSRLQASVWRVQHDLHETTTVGSIPVQAGYEAYVEGMAYDLAELFSDQRSDDDAPFGASAYVEANLAAGSGVEVRPGVVLMAAPQAGVEPRLRVSWEPFGRPSERLQGSVGFYRQSVVGVSDMRDVSSVFTAWMSAPDGAPEKAFQGSLGWQQSLGGGLRWSLDGYYKRLEDIPVPIWRAVARFTTRLGRADGEVYGADLRLEYTRPHVYGFLGYGYNWTLYEASREEFASWFGEPVQSYHPPHDRRHQLNVLASLDVGNFKASARWQFGSGLPYTRPMGFDEAFDYARHLYDVHTGVG